MRCILERNHGNNKMTQEYSGSEKFEAAISKLNCKAGLSGKFSLKPLQGGRNNKVFCIAYDNGARALLKAYFKHQNDKRNRLKTELSFINFAWNHNVRCVPRPLAADFRSNLGLYEFIDGKKLHSHDIDPKKITHALEFFIKLNKHKNTKEAERLPAASDSCFSIKEHLSHVEKRIEKLKKIKSNSDINRKAKTFVGNELLKEWKKSLKYVKISIAKNSFDISRKISHMESCISPSDFGFHNALQKSNKTYFVDFEYAGFDDPAKMVCDFFSQPEVRVPLKYLDFFIKKVADNVSNPKEFEKRVAALLPIYRVKWCCIMLNDFLEDSSVRRSFAHGASDLEQRKTNQLEKARSYLKNRILN